MNFIFNCPICNQKLYLNGCHNQDCKFKYFDYKEVKKVETEFLNQIV